MRANKQKTKSVKLDVETFKNVEAVKKITKQGKQAIMSASVKAYMAHITSAREVTITLKALRK